MKIKNSINSLIKKIKKKIKKIKKKTKKNKKLNEIKKMLKIKNLKKEELIFLEKELKKLKKKINKGILKSKLNKKINKKNAILTLNAGSGGIDSEDFCCMLFNMYDKYFEKKKIKRKIIDIQKSGEKTIKNATFLIEKKYAYGYFRMETGIHRLVRISPFNTNKKRQTSFVSVAVIPEIKEKKEKKIDKEIKIETFKSSGKGGQHANKTETAVRITHIPTSLWAVSRNERSQLFNKEIALKVLKSKIIKFYKEEKEKKKIEKNKKKNKATFGSQTRNYVLFPYKLVKDLRTGFKTNKIEKILSGEIHKMLLYNIKKKKS